MVVPFYYHLVSKRHGYIHASRARRVMRRCLKASKLYCQRIKHLVRSTSAQISENQIYVPPIRTLMTPGLPSLRAMTSLNSPQGHWQFQAYTITKALTIRGITFFFFVYEHFQVLSQLVKLSCKVRAFSFLFFPFKLTQHCRCFLIY